MKDPQSDREAAAAQKDIARVFTGAFKARNRMLSSVSIVLASAAPFALALIVITYFVPDPVGWAAAVITVLAFLTAGGCTWVVQDRFALAGNRGLRKRLQEQLGGNTPLATCTGQREFIGFSPGGDILTWDGETDLDVGFLCLDDEGLTFVGDRFSWSLAKGRIDRIDLTPAPLGPRRIVVHWHAPREPGRSFTLESREATSLRQADSRTIGLFKGMRQWTLTEPETDEPRVALGYPPTSHYGGMPIDSPVAGWCQVTLAMMVIIVLTIWYLAMEMLRDGFHYHAVLWAGFVFVGGTVFTRCLLHYLQSSTEPPKPRPRTSRP